jgi:hypothetical protein
VLPTPRAAPRLRRQSSGSVGPNLDDAGKSFDKGRQGKERGGGMPSFEAT